jgi:hypothetical protein
LFGNAFFEKFASIESENEELKFQNKILELQLSTLKRKKLDQFKQLEVEIFELAQEQQKVVSRLSRIFELLKNGKFS